MRVNIEMAGTSPLIMHNAQLSDPENSFVKAIAQLTSKDDKTPDDQTEIGRLEFMGGLYVGSKGIVIPAANILKCLVNAAKLHREGAKVQRGLLPTGLEFALIYDGPRTPNDLWADERFHFRKSVKVGRARIMRMRPRFINWKLLSEWELLPDVLDLQKSLRRIISDGGLSEGLGDARNQGYGRYVGTATVAVAARKAA